MADLKTVLLYVHSLTVCSVNDESKYEGLNTLKKGNFMNHSGMIDLVFHLFILFIGTQCVAFYDCKRKTIQSEECLLLLPQSEGSNPVKYCGPCEECRQVLNRLLYRTSYEGKDNDNTSINSHTNYRFLSTPEKMTRMKRMHSHIRVAQQQISRLNARIEKLIEDRGTVVDDELSEYLTEITEEKSDAIAQSHADGSFAKSFWEQQCKALLLKKMPSMRWDPIMIRWCLYLRHLSGSSAYEMLRESGVIKLPSQRTLRDYTYYTKTTCGFSDDVDQQLMEAADISTCKERDKYVILMMDEMHIKEDIIYDKHTGILLLIVYNNI